MAIVHVKTRYEEIVELHSGSRDIEWPILSIFPCEYEPQIVPDHFIIGPSFVAIASDVDCDGTGWSAHGIKARNLAEAEEIAARQLSNYSGWNVMTAAEAATEHGIDIREIFEDPDFMYATLGFDRQPWCDDDTIGIPALDTRHEEDIPTY